MPKTLLDADAVGGATAREGFEYQDAFALQHLPQWLSQDAFSHVVSEALGDVEACYFAGPGQFKRYAFEAKGNRLTLSQLWAELEQFHTIWEASPDEFERFGLVCSEYVDKFQPLVNMLARLRGVGGSYSTDSSIIEETRQKLVRWLVDNGQSTTLADFIIERVDFIEFSSANADAVFKGKLAEHFESLGMDLSGRQQVALAGEFKRLFDAAHLGPVSRAALEQAIAKVVGTSVDWMALPSRLTLDSRAPSLGKLGLDATDFLAAGAEARLRADWASAGQRIDAIREFLLGSRARRSVALPGQLRMSLACFVGAHLKATHEMHLQVKQRDEIFRTGNYGAAPGPMFSCSDEPAVGVADEGVLVVEAATLAAGADIDAFGSGALKGMPRRTLTRAAPLTSSEEFHWAAQEAKASLAELRARHGLKRVHLFLKGPAVLGVFLGYRLNAVGRVQLYDWVGDRYVATAELQT